MATGSDMLSRIFSAHDALARVEATTWVHGLDWKREDGQILYPQNMMTGHLYGLFKILWPATPLRVFSAEMFDYVRYCVPEERLAGTATDGAMPRA